MNWPADGFTDSRNGVPIGKDTPLTVQTRGHAEGQGGLRGHSIGKDYPYICKPQVILDGLQCERTVWRVFNVLTGEVCSHPTTCEHAHGIAAALKMRDTA